MLDYDAHAKGQMFGICPLNANLAIMVNLGDRATQNLAYRNEHVHAF